MSSLYIGVYQAIYSYSAQADEELTIEEGDLLYVLEKSDIDEWWKVKKRVVAVNGEEVEEPVGLVPSNYIEPAPVLKTATALYNYDKQTEEELSFQENDQFNVYDLNDPDWILVGDVATGVQFGFVPANYLEFLDSNTTTGTNPPYVPEPVTPTVSTSQEQAQRAPISTFAPPPQHKDRMKMSPATENSNEGKPLPSIKRYNDDYEDGTSPPQPRRPNTIQNLDDDGPPPPMPARPTGSSSNFQDNSPSKKSTYENDDHEEPEQFFDGEYFTWYINEIDGRRKRAITLSIGGGQIILKPRDSAKLSLKSSSTVDEQWKIRDLVSHSSEKKHVFLEFKHPQASIELHAGSKDVADAIMSILGDLKGADAARGLREVARASEPTRGPNNRKIGRLMFDFVAQGDDELQCREGDEIYIIDETKSKDWWMVENIDSGRRGVVPSSYIEIVGSSALDKLTEQPSRKKTTKKSKGRLVDSGSRKSENQNKKSRNRDERERIRERDQAQREKMKSKYDGNDKSMPNFHRVRTWIDSSGSFKVEAEFLGCVEGKIHLHKTNGVKIAVAASKLCIEDLEYVEKVTGSSLEYYKNEVAKQISKKSNKGSGVQQSATASINNVSSAPPPQPKRPQTTSNNIGNAESESDYDWFDFFLSCGVDIGNCQRYSLNFSREKMDETILQDITPSLLRTLGLREGDILRVMKFLDNKFNRKHSPQEASTPAGALFVDSTGALKNNNSSSEISKVSANALPPAKNVETPTQNSSKFEDDAWAVKPAAKSSEDLLKSQPSKNSTPQYSGSLQDLVNIKPLEAGKPSDSSTQQTPSTSVLTPVKNSASNQSGDLFDLQKTGAKPISNQATGSLVPTQKTGNLVPVQRTGGLVPVQRTGGLVSVQPTGGLVAMPTGFAPITAQPTGFVPIQQTGVITAQPTFGIIPIQTGTSVFTQQKTGGAMPITTFGQPVLVPSTTFGTQATGGMMPQTSFGQNLSVQKTGPLVPVQRTGGQPTGGVMAQSSFGQPVNNQFTGGFSQQQPVALNQQATGGFPSTTFNQQPNIGFQPTNTFNQQQQQQQQQTGMFPQSTFNQQPIFNNQAQQTGFFGQTQQNIQPFQQQSTFVPNQNTFGSQFNQAVPQNTFGGQSFTQQPQQGFNQFQQQQPNMAQLTNMFQNTSIQPTTSFGQQPQFDGFPPQPLQSQPTGVGFGNSPLTSQATGKRANLQAATADNPFGF